jgi:glycosyltransferase involved in cell wall biosynthesis
VHNARKGWPPDYAAAGEPFADLLIGVSLATTRELREAGLGPARTIWNGIAAQPPACKAQRDHIRKQLGIPSAALVSVSVANRRAQKRLELIPPVIRELRATGIDAHAIVVGGESPEAISADAPPARQEENGRVHWVGSQADVATWCSAGDVYLCTSEYEGLSLAQLEALAVGLPIVSTNVGGAEEISRACDRCNILPVDAAPKTFAAAIIAATRPALPTPMPQFSSHRMAARHALLYRRTTHRLTRDRGGLLLVANDFAPGGAQASSARLLSALTGAGVPCAAFVIAEDLENPTAGTTALRAAGIPVHAAERSRRRHSEKLAGDVIAKADELGVTALAFWNAITELKVRIADLATSIPVFDVSPGEMYFSSLDRYFENPAPDMPYLCARDYGALLKAAVVKYGAEAEKARAVLNTEVHVIPNGVWLAPQEPRPRESGCTIGTIARLSPDKRIDDLVDAFRLALPRLPPCELLIGGAPDIGAERYAAGLAERTAGLPIRWLGQVDPRSLLPRLDLFVLVAEPAGCPNASLEAMAAGVPVLATDVGGMREQIEEGVTGWLAPRRDIRAFAARLEDALGHRARLHEMGRAAREHIRRRFSIEQMRDRYRALFGLA